MPRIWLTVPPLDRPIATSLGAEYDVSKRRFYVSFDDDLSKFSQWIKRPRRKREPAPVQLSLLDAATAPAPPGPAPRDDQEPAQQERRRARGREA